MSSVSFERPVLRVGRYRILSELGRGGMSNVYLAVAHGPGGVNKLVVLKALLPDLSAEPYALSMFLDEARLAAQLNHPNVVQTYEVGTEGDRHVIVMEYLEGQALSTVIKRSEQAGRPLSLALHLRIIIAALEGLHYAHELRAYDGAPLQLVHRDISPQNVFVTYDGQVKVLDFGIAKAATSSTHTATGIVKGKIAYMAPEQTIADNVDRRADIYSIGCMLWAAATGRKLWKDTPDVHIMRRVINGEIPTPQSANPSCDDELNRVVMKALATDQDQRYHTALELQQDLEAYSERLREPAKQKDIARHVATLFADKRAEIKALVERQLALAGSDDTSGSRGIPVLTSDVKVSTTTGTHPSWIPTQQGGTLSQRRPKAVWLVPAVVVVGALALWLKHSAGNAAEAPQPASAPVTVAQPAPAPTSVTIEFRASPASAKLYLDGDALPSNPTSKIMHVDDTVHRFRAEADGFNTATSEFTSRQDTKLELSLAQTTPAAPATAEDEAAATTNKGRTRAVRGVHARPVEGPAGGPAPTAAATSAPKANCDAPFFVDKDGIKKMRPECL
ncbi:MAG TPA: serine/threonine-protein kinase [Polyangiaceae bacterium]|nr:serine/threonine-protein kinase [Polyangiaceae bacterium]